METFFNSKEPKKILAEIINWCVGMFFISLGIALEAKCNFGMSGISAPGYILHLFLSQFFTWYSHGLSETIFQMICLLVTILICMRFKLKWLLTFAVAVLQGWIIDFCYFFLGGSAPYTALWARIVSLIIAQFCISFAVALLFKTNMPLQVAELMVKEISERYKWTISKVKLIYDIIMLCVSLILSLALTKKLTALGIGTLTQAFLNAPLIAIFTKWFDKIQARTNTIS